MGEKQQQKVTHGACLAGSAPSRVHTGAMLHCHHPEMPNNFILEFLLCKYNLMRWWRMCISREDTRVCASTISSTLFMVSRQQATLWAPRGVGRCETEPHRASQARPPVRQQAHCRHAAILPF